MANISNQWVGYLTRSHLQIKNSVLSRLGELVPEITDHSESNILVIIISIFSGIAEMLNYYIDNMAREAFITTARRYSSVVKHTRLIDYRIKASVPASVDVTISFVNLLDVLVPIPNDILIPIGTVFTTDNNVQFLSTTDVNILAGESVGLIPLQQVTFLEQQNLGETNGAEDQTFSLGRIYAHDTIFLTIGGIPWERKDTLGRSEPEDKHYIVEISSDKVAYIKFGDDVNGKKPEANQVVLADYYETLGVGGNVGANIINTTEFDFSVLPSPPTKVIINNNAKAVAGTNYESIERIRRSAPLSLRTLDRAVTRQDYKDTAALAPGVDKSEVFYNCGKYVTIYISPNGGGIAQTALLMSTKNYIDARKMITTFIIVEPAGESYLRLGITAHTRFRRDPIVARQDIINALLEEYSYDNSDINRPIRLSDVIALVDNLEKIDYLAIDYKYLIPYMRPKQHSIPLQNTFEVLPGSVDIIKWELEWDGNYMRLKRDNIVISNIELGTDFIHPNNIFTFNITNNGYVVGNKWTFTTYPYNENIEVDDYSIPIIVAQNLNITVIENISNN